MAGRDGRYHATHRSTAHRPRPPLSGESCPNRHRPSSEIGVDPADARADLTAWCKKAVRSKLRPFVVLAARTRNNFDGLIAAVEWGLSKSRPRRHQRQDPPDQQPSPRPPLRRISRRIDLPLPRWNHHPTTHTKVRGYVRLPRPQVWRGGCASTPKPAGHRRGRPSIGSGHGRGTPGRPDLHLHDLRHFANTLAASSGASTRELMVRLGHASSAAALRYQHATAERDRAIADRMDEMITGRLSKPVTLRVLKGAQSKCVIAVSTAPISGRWLTAKRTESNR